MPVDRRAPHPDNELNELPGEEWLYFTKSLWTTAYPSKLGHAARRAHGPRRRAATAAVMTRTRFLCVNMRANAARRSDVTPAMRRKVR